jgi:selenocysteine lyase/cysteine desulfurase
VPALVARQHVERDARRRRDHLPEQGLDGSAAGAAAAVLGGVAVSGGKLNAQTALARFGLESATRASCRAYNTAEELDRLADALRSIRRS